MPHYTEYFMCASVISIMNEYKLRSVYLQKYKCQYTNYYGRIIVLFPFKDLVEWQHKLTVGFKVLLQLTELLTVQKYTNMRHTSL